jgi:serine/threonine protein kinase
MTRVCGEGAYGKVIDLGDGTAQKTLKDLCSFIQEYLAFKYVKGWNNVLQGKGGDFKNLTINMELCSGSLRKYIEENKDPGESTKLSLFFDILKGLYNLHCNGIIHADIKPGNLLIKDGSVIIGDLGFFNVKKYARVYNTARPYRDPECIPHYTHDLYSLGMVLAEIFLWRRVDKKKIIKEIKHIDNKNVRDMITSLVGPRDYRPHLQDIANTLYSSSLISNIKDIPKASRLEEKVEKVIFKYMRQVCSIYKINRGKIGFKALIAYLRDKKIDSQMAQLYTCAILYILSCLFGGKEFDYRKAVKASLHKEEEFLQAIQTLCDHEDFVNIIFACYK